jgi:hypothetical protein
VLTVCAVFPVKSSCCMLHGAVLCRALRCAGCRKDSRRAAGEPRPPAQGSQSQHSRRAGACEGGGAGMNEPLPGRKPRLAPDSRAVVVLHDCLHSEPEGTLAGPAPPASATAGQQANSRRAAKSGKRKGVQEEVSSCNAAVGYIQHRCHKQHTTACGGLCLLGWRTTARLAPSAAVDVVSFCPQGQPSCQIYSQPPSERFITWTRAPTGPAATAGPGPSCCCCAAVPAPVLVIGTRLFTMSSLVYMLSKTVSKPGLGGCWEGRAGLGLHRKTRHEFGSCSGCPCQAAVWNVAVCTCTMCWV